jgi:hypothetical protein
MCEGCVLLIAGVWQTAQPTEVNNDFPLAIEVGPPGVVVDGTGGASNRMNCANASTSLRTVAFRGSCGAGGVCVVGNVLRIPAAREVEAGRRQAVTLHLFFGSGTILCEQLIGDAHLDVVGLSREDHE